jgi:Glu-tRNA(Gln) amidotransferase subunit E-like FAD-binding protein
MPEEKQTIDYSKAGLKSGLEIHQQLDTGKLFCGCPSVLRKDEPDFEIRRKLHAVAGESGLVDIAAKHEAEKDKEFIYQGYKDNTCLIELDEEPPHEINKDALKIAVQIALLLNCRFLSLTQIMRKTVIDGSNTSGFQRTVLIGLNGFVETSYGKVRIDSIALEEDAARIIEKKDKESVFRLDRLGIPLVEIVTAPDMKTPEQIKEAALLIGGILRSLKVKRGIGTIRQDVNVSIKGGARTEIKGFQEPAIMIKTIDNEILRQKELVSKNKKVEETVRKVLPDATTEFLRPIPGAARMYPETDLPLLKISRELIDNSRKDMPKMKNEIEEELRKEGLNEEMIKLLFQQGKVEEFKELINIYNNPNLIAKILLIFPKEIASHEKIPIEEIEIKLEDNYSSIVSALVKKKISESQIKGVIKAIVEGKTLEEAIKVEKTEVSDIEERIMKIIKEKPGLNINAYMGLVMKEFKGISGKEVMEIIGKYLRK